ncbi:hypothetical protein [Deinococcus cellulosilyticus]|uniref:Uncharacterized protein n=1 Tax=Deinococcus cellulosilyticus (strain DSM 18568 / NBRC 106333 / KACC 11606 / 5516J-15) TaxID=1223518 RepID=A0A511N007_DEIC1|nr:hypothetical protein [Deinococcus cellulosilyticus]GEM46220.1 hypothetical protein DC3_18550 [Deinococcus cellulosilyticus NBRC 106333 = KACC 11606]
MDAQILRTVTGDVQVKLLTDPRSLRHLQPFFSEASTTSEAARKLQVSVHHMMYWTRKFRDAGLIEVHGNLVLHGRSIPRYQTTAGTFLVPFRHISQASLKELLAHFGRPWEDLLNHHLVRATTRHVPDVHQHSLRITGQRQLHIDLYGEDQALHDQLQAKEAPALLTEWHVLSLSPEDAKRLQHELLEMLHRYQQLQGPQQHLLRLALTPTLS